MRILQDVEEIAGSVLLAGMALLAFANVMARYLLEFSFAFTEEIEVALLVWITMLGAAAGFKRALHLGFTFLSERLPRGIQKGLSFLSALLSVICLCVLAWYGVLQIRDEHLLSITTEALGIHQYWYTLAMPVGAFIIIVRIIQATVAALRKDRG